MGSRSSRARAGGAADQQEVNEECMNKSMDCNKFCCLNMKHMACSIPYNTRACLRKSGPSCKNRSDLHTDGVPHECIGTYFWFLSAIVLHRRALPMNLIHLTAQ